MSDLDIHMNDDTARRVYGVLATSLNEALVEMRQALDPHAVLLPKGRIGDIDALLAEFANRRVRIALYGEVKAGKSTLLNALAGAELSPVAFDPLTSIPVRITHGTKTVWQVGAHRLESVADLTQLMRAGVRDASEVVIETNVDLLQLGGQVDVVDTPGVGSDARFDAISADTLKSLDAVVLVVRYPALYTQVTRGLVESLQTDIGKLFIVWNLDADCAELPADERTRQAEKLRQEVAGAHELYLVDARAAFAPGSARQGAAGRQRLEQFRRRWAFAASDKRQRRPARSRQARAKWINEGAPCWPSAQVARRQAERHARVPVGSELADECAARRAHSSPSFRRRRRRRGQQRAAAVGARPVHRAVRAARHLGAQRRITELQPAVAAACEAYARPRGPQPRRLRRAVRAAKKFGTVIPTAPPERTDLRPAIVGAARASSARSAAVSARCAARCGRWYRLGSPISSASASAATSALAARFEQAAKNARTRCRRARQPPGRDRPHRVGELERIASRRTSPPKRPSSTASPSMSQRCPRNASIEEIGRKRALTS
jgi:hypothetical protein